MTLDIFTKFATDEKLENHGAWFELGSNCKVLVARSGNRQYQKHLTKLVEQNRAVLDMADDLAESKSDEIMISVLANTILLGWSGLSFKGEELKYSVENARTLLAFRDFRKVITQFSEQFDGFQLKEEKAQGEA